MQPRSHHPYPEAIDYYTTSLLARTNVRGYEVLKKPLCILNSTPSRLVAGRKTPSLCSSTGCTMPGGVGNTSGRRLPKAATKHAASPCVATVAAKVWQRGFAWFSVSCSAVRFASGCPLPAYARRNRPSVSQARVLCPGKCLAGGVRGLRVAATNVMEKP